MAKVPSEWTVLTMMEWATSYFQEKQITNPRLSIEYLLSEVLRCKRLDLYIQYDRPLKEEELSVLKPMVQRRAKHEPLQYIIGYTEFMHARIDVAPGVLIPRPETEQLVEMILEQEDEQPKTILDIGTGSGCIAIALKMERPQWQVFALELSEEALHQARKNAVRNQVEVHFLHKDATTLAASDLPAVDVVVSNPPYIRPEEGNSLDKEVVAYEPHVALFHEKPDALYFALQQAAARVSKPEARLYLEIHENLGAELVAKVQGEHWDARLMKDYAQRDRYIFARKK